MAPEPPGSNDPTQNTPPPSEGSGERCPECGGTGKRDGRRCPACEGSGNVMHGLGGG
jgi:DnaJ-class molecular chaperone